MNFDLLQHQPLHLELLKHSLKFNNALPGPWKVSVDNESIRIIACAHTIQAHVTSFRERAEVAQNTATASNIDIAPCQDLEGWRLNPVSLQCCDHFSGEVMINGEECSPEVKLSGDVLVISYHVNLGSIDAVELTRFFWL